MRQYNCPPPIFNCNWSMLEGTLKMCLAVYHLHHRHSKTDLTYAAIQELSGGDAKIRHMWHVSSGLAASSSLDSIRGHAWKA